MLLSPLFSPHASNRERSHKRGLRKMGRHQTEPAYLNQCCFGCKGIGLNQTRRVSIRLERCRKHRGTILPEGRTQQSIGETTPVGRTASDAEANDLYRTMIAYSGAYSIEGNKVRHKIEYSWNQAWTGTNQQRFVDVKDNQLTIKLRRLSAQSAAKRAFTHLCGSG